MCNLFDRKLVLNKCHFLIWCLSTKYGIEICSKILTYLGALRLPRIFLSGVTPPGHIPPKTKTVDRPLFFTSKIFPRMYRCVFSRRTWIFPFADED